MKKLWILALAVIMALGVAAVAGAAKPARIPVRITVNKFSTIETMHEGPLRVRLVEPGNFDDSSAEPPLYMSDSANFTVKTNHPVTVTITIQEIVDKLIELVGAENVWYPGGPSNYAISPNLVVDTGHDPNPGGWLDNGHTVKIGINEKGSYDYKLRVEARWNAGGQWWEVPALQNEYLGNVVITVAAQ